MTTESIRPDPATSVTSGTGTEVAETEVGSVFVSNYPPYSFWHEGDIPAARETLRHVPQGEVPPLGLYLHIPFCRKRCKFCYFRVYVDKNAAQIETYLEALSREVEIYSRMERIDGRTLDFVYFGGGTPSYISARHLKGLASKLRDSLSWEHAREVAFECEPGTLTQAKLEAIKEIGVTRLSLGVENLSDEILRENGRAHVSKEVYRVVPWIRELDFQWWNADLIAGMVGETWDSWKETVRRTIELDADSITVYQMELPHNTVYSKGMTEGGGPLVADWQTKREWHQYAFDEFAAAGYLASSAYTMVKEGTGSAFLYRDALWRGSEMIGAGVSSISYVGGVHYQNDPSWDGYLSSLAQGELPLTRALVTTPEQRLTRELILQLKLGRLSAAYFADRHGVDIFERYGEAFATLEREGMARVQGEEGREREVELTPQGLLRVDQLLPSFYAPEHRNVRYT